MSQIRILHLVDNLNKGSGVMSFIMNAYRHIDREKVQFDFLVALQSENDNFEEEIIKLGGHVCKISIPKISFKISDFKYFFKAVNEFFKERKGVYKAIHSHVPTLNIFYFNYAKKYKIEKRIVHSHSTKSSSSKLKEIRNYFMLLFVKNQANIYLACSEKAAIHLYGKKKWENKEVLIIKNGIDYKKFNYNESIREKYRYDLGLDDKFVVGHVGRFSKEKNHDFLLSIFNEILKRDSNSILLLIGDGELRETIKAKGMELGINENIKFLGVRDDVHNIMNALDVFVLPSFFEGLGIAAVEAQVSGLPCFVSDKVPKEIDFNNGLVSFINIDKSPRYWVDQIESCEKHKQIKRIDISLKDFKYDIQDTVKKLEKFYIDL